MGRGRGGTITMDTIAVTKRAADQRRARCGKKIVAYTRVTIITGGTRVNRVTRAIRVNRVTIVTRISIDNRVNIVARAN